MALKVLIVDDEKEFLNILAERIAARGMDVSTASSAEDALKMIEEQSYDVVSKIKKAQKARKKK